jgi:hypothetical protein
MLEDMLKTLPGLIQIQPAIELFPSSRAIVHFATATGDTMWFLRTIGIHPDNLFPWLDRDIPRQIKRGGSIHHHNSTNGCW